MHEVNTHREPEPRMSDTTSKKNFKLIDRGDGWWELCFDQPDAKANVFNESALSELDELTEQLKSRSDIKGLVLTSAKDGIFIAGADINLIKALDTYEKALNQCTLGQQLIHRFSKLPFEKVAAIDGACLGGGFEISLACEKRIASDHKRVKIGLPEVNLGVLPGFGGSCRLPRLTKLTTALDMILSGKQLDGKRALKAGAINAMLPYQDFNERAVKWAKANAGKPGATVKKTIVDTLIETPFGRSFVLGQARKTVLKKTKGHYPAPFKILDLLGKTIGRDLESSLKIEAQAFAELAVTSVSKHCIDIFQMTEAVKKTNGVGDSVQGQKVERAAVLGAGVMGGGIAHAFSKVGIPVRMKDITNEALALGYKQAASIYSFGVKRRRMTKTEFNNKMHLISGSLGYEGFKVNDVVVEAVVEIMDVKKKVLQECENESSANMIFATNTSSLSVTELQKAAKRPENVVGMHFFNPVNRMPLVEVIRGEQTGDVAVATIYDLAKKMGKIPIVCGDCAGFLVNRLLLPYMNEALFLLEEGVSIERIDKAMLSFGMPMGPIRLIDEVGIDVAAKVAKIIYDAHGERAQYSKLSERIVQSGRLGRKNGKGFYKWENDKAVEADESIYELVDSSSKAENLSDAELVYRMVLPMVNEAALLLEEKIVDGPDKVDLGMIMGTGFPPFRGGLLRYADAEGIKKVVEQLQKMADAGCGKRAEPNAAMKAVAERGGFYK